MKKTYALLLILLALAVGSVGVIASIVYGQRDNVTIREYVVYGDKSAAEGVTVVNKMHLRNHLFWETTYRVGEEPLGETNYKFVARGNEIEQEYIYTGISIIDDIQCGYPGRNESMNDLQKEYDELYRSLKKGEVGSKKLYIKDYYDYYPIQMNVNLPDTVWVNNPQEIEVEEQAFHPKYVQKKFQEFFKIPVLETDYAQIIVSKAKASPNSNVAYSEERSVEPNFYQVGTVSTFTDKVCYFAINNRSMKYAYSYESYEREAQAGEYVDTSLIPGGYGIYAFSYSKGTSESQTGVDADSLKMVFSLEQDVAVKHMMIRENQTQLVLFTEEDEGAFVRIIDLASMKELQKIRIDDTLYNRFGYYADIFDYEDFIVIVYGENITVISVVNGVYEHEFTVLAEANERCYFPANNTSYNIAMDFDGEKLAVVGLQGGYAMRFQCDYCLIVYDASGMLYYGEYMTGMSNLECDPTVGDTNYVSW